MEPTVLDGDCRVDWDGWGEKFFAPFTMDWTEWMSFERMSVEC